MHWLKKTYCRVYQAAFHAALPLLPYREPEILPDIAAVAHILQQKQNKKVLIVTGPSICKRPYFQTLTYALKQNGIDYAVYSKTSANPTVQNVYEGKALYIEAQCDSLIAFGGGSPIDCAKAIGACIAYPKRELQKLKGNLRVRKRIPLLIAIPTTAGSGSETTLTAVITDEQTHHKYTVNSFPLIPHYAVLDPSVTFTLPQHLTATTGMDALTHAVEVCIGRSTTKHTKEMATNAVKLIFANLETAYQHPTNRKARAAMLQASYLAGCAFSKSYVGYVHAIAHSLGGKYNLAHGFTNAVLLPQLLESYGKAVYRPLSELAIAVGIADTTDTSQHAAEKFISAIRKMNERMQIPAVIHGVSPADIPQMAAHADKEANPLYPVPVLWDQKELMAIYEKATVEN